VTNKTVDIVVEALAVFRATRLIQQDNLPPLPELREQLYAKIGDSRWADLIDCPWCLSVWLGGVSQLVKTLSPRLWRIGATVLASSAVAGVISEWLDNMQLPETAAEAVESMEAATAQMNEAADRIRPMDQRMDPDKITNVRGIDRP
jgi:Protein of unknown function (DUF1360)